MTYKTRLLWIVLAAALTTFFAYQISRIPLPFVYQLQGSLGYPRSYLLMLGVNWLELIIAAVPSLALLAFKKFPNAALVSAGAAVEAYMLSFLAAIFSMMVLQLQSWTASQFVSILASYTVVDFILNQAQFRIRYRLLVLAGLLTLTGIAFVAVLRS